MNFTDDPNPYSSPNEIVRAELADKPPKPGPLPVGAIVVGLVLVFMLSAGLSLAIHPVASLLFPMSLIAVLAWACVNEIRVWQHGRR